ncbi:MAG TPA: isochorismatase family cysteine hydrolase [Gaiellaceae bacterium]
MRDALLLVDLINTFEHEDGDALLASFRERLPGMRAALAEARSGQIPVIYVNDQGSRWDGDALGLVRSTIDEGRGGDLIAELRPEQGERFILKPRYSAFDHTSLVLLLEELGIERLLLAGAATEGCVVQSSIDARELGYKVTIIVSACATNDERLERISLQYAEQVAGARLHENLAAARDEPGDSG